MPARQPAATSLGPALTGAAAAAAKAVTAPSSVGRPAPACAGQPTAVRLGVPAYSLKALWQDLCKGTPQRDATNTTTHLISTDINR